MDINNSTKIIIINLIFSLLIIPIGCNHKFSSITENKMHTGHFQYEMENDKAIDQLPLFKEANNCFKPGEDKKLHENTQKVFSNVLQSETILRKSYVQYVFNQDGDVIKVSLFLDQKIDLGTIKTLIYSLKKHHFDPKVSPKLLKNVCIRL